MLTHLYVHVEDAVPVAAAGCVVVVVAATGVLSYCVGCVWYGVAMVWRRCLQPDYGDLTPKCA